MLFDGYYRTLRGFIVLIEKDWKSFGHQFEKRNGIGYTSPYGQYSPIFFQFLDCVNTLLLNYPNDFEFNEQFLLELYDAIYCSDFGTFMFDCERQRVETNIEAITPSFWEYVISQECKFINPNYNKKMDELELSQNKLLDEYTREITIGDETNREGHSAKVYFNALFGLSFSREWNTFINSALNYGYAILLSIFNRTIVANGYNTQIGLFHRSEYNPHNFACDLMEPFRILVDRLVCTMEGKELQIEHKRILQDIINQKVKIKNKLYTVNDAVNIYCKSVFDALNNDNIELLEFYEL